MTNSYKLMNGQKDFFARYASEIKNHHPDHFTSNPVLNEAYIQNFSAKLSFAIH